jgi:histidinol-phosphate aminotransferase
MNAIRQLPSRNDEPRAVAAVALERNYAPPRHPAPIDLKLDAGEADASLLVSRYPDVRPLERALADRHGVDPSSVLVTAGADDALDRVCRAMLEPGREIVLPVPTFEMLARYARLTGATVKEVAWPDGPYPVDAVLRASGEATSVIAVVSPNNPTGASASAGDLARLAQAAPQALLLVDLAYVEFADEDPTRAALALPNAVVTRTLSKAWGLAGLRVGYAVGPARWIELFRRIGQPYPVSTPALSIAQRTLERGAPAMRARVAAVRRDREALFERLADLGAGPSPSQANFVLARSPKSRWLRDALAGLGIGVRLFEDARGDAVRISCPADAASYRRLDHALSAALRPEALLFDMDGVLADVSGSYRRAIVETAASFGVVVSAADVAAVKAEGNASNDWLVTQRLCARRGVDAPLAEVIVRFERAYAVLADSERLVPRRETLERLARRLALAVVTGRPRAQAEQFLAARGLDGLFATLVCMEDAPAKPDPAPLRLALERLGAKRAWMIGDTPDDMRAARGAGVVPVGFLGALAAAERPAAREALLSSGAARALVDLDSTLELIE